MENLSKRMADLKASPVRRMLNTSLKPGVISFAGGLPSEESFFNFTGNDVLQNAMQYGPSEGEPELRKLISQDLNNLNIDCDENQIIILSGSQQGIDLVSKLLIDNGTSIALESPTYLAALQVFRFFGASFEEIPSQIENIQWSKQNHPKFAYVIPTFQNPTGKCWTNQARESFANKCEASGTILFEDDPYRELAFDDCDREPCVSFMRNGSWIYQGSFSKILSPGLRIGYIAASKDLIGYLTLLKQAADLHTNRLSQYMVIDFLKSSERKTHINKIIANYKLKRDNFASNLYSHFGNNIEWECPKGGLFFWIKIREDISAQKVFESALENNVIFTPGEHFFANPESIYQSIRLNFSHSSIEEATKGLKILSEILKKY